MTLRIAVILGGNAFVRRAGPERAARDAKQIARLFPAGASLHLLGYGAETDAASIASRLADEIRSESGPCILAGISFGGLVAMRIAAEHPDLVTRLILISTAHRFSDEGRRRIEQQIADVSRGDFAAMARPFLTLFRRPWLNLLVRAALWMRRGSLAEAMNEPSYIARMLTTALAGVDRAFLARITAPTLLLLGTNDQFFDMTAASDTVGSIAMAKLVPFPRETHMVAVEAWPRVARAIGEFL